MRHLIVLASAGSWCPRHGTQEARLLVAVKNLWRILWHGFTRDTSPANPQKALEVSRLCIAPMVARLYMCNSTPRPWWT